MAYRQVAPKRFAALLQILYLFAVFSRAVVFCLLHLGIREWNVEAFTELFQRIDIHFLL